MQNDVDELQFNPFASPLEADSIFLSSSSSQTDSSDTNSNSFLSPKGTGHARARTDSEVNTIGPSSQDHHPLRSAGLSSNFEDAGITRPHLTRALDNGRLVDVLSTEDDHQEESQVNEKLVIIHQVSSNDSLAGVALMYGINLTELRRANHLWASDSIHLRKVLYIPVEKTSQAVPKPSAAEPGSPHSLEGNSASPLEDANSRRPTFSPSTIRRVPASKLSFFPPPSKSSALSSAPPSPPIQAPTFKPSHARYATSPPPSLNSILTALPIAASTRDTIIARLSFDSTSSSYSDRERGPYLDDVEGHELEDVQSQRMSRTLSEDSSQDYFDGPALKNTSNHKTSSVNSNSKVRDERLGHGRSFSEEYMGPPPSMGSTRIRNFQLEPSPVMQIPTRAKLPQLRAQGSKSARSKVRPGLKDVSFDSEESLDEIQAVGD